MDVAVAPTGGVPCDVAAVISNNCTACHQAVPQFGATMPLLTLADFHAPARSNPGRKVVELVGERINATEASRRMPPMLQPALSQVELDTLNFWIGGGAQAGATVCPITVGTLQTGGAGTGGMAGGEPPTPVASGLSLTPIEYNDPLMECYELRAHAPGNRMTPYTVSTQPDNYQNFDFMPQWTGMRYVRSFRLLLDNAAVVHHWLLFKNTGPKTDLAVSASSGTHPDGELLHGWAPGGGDLYFAPDVGTEMPDNKSYTFELHYNNGTGAPAQDSTGVEVCVTPTRPENLAVLSWLGTDGINGTSATGVCDPTSNERIHIIGGTPHMHTKGTHMKVELTRAGGAKEMVHDEPFDFNTQIVYIEDLWLEPGDSIATTCTYREPASFGAGTSAEMCYWFAMHYPALALTNGNPIAGFIHGPNTCL
jgi:hypothetical protein